MSKETYVEKLQRPEWQKKRLEILERDGWKCKQCKDATSQLQIHHRYYVSHRDPWLYPGWCFVTLCKSCHEEQGKIYDGPKEWESLLNTLCEDGSEGDLMFAWSFHSACRRHGIGQAGLLRAITDTLEGSCQMDEAIEKYRALFPLTIVDPILKPVEVGDF